MINFYYLKIDYDGNDIWEYLQDFEPEPNDYITEFFTTPFIPDWLMVEIEEFWQSGWSTKKFKTLEGQVVEFYRFNHIASMSIHVYKGE